jgi:hypothetical protein
MSSINACWSCGQIGRDSSHCPRCGRRLELLDFETVHSLLRERGKRVVPRGSVVGTHTPEKEVAP